MSRAPNNPFDTQRNEYQQPPQQRQGSNTWLWVLGIIGGLFLAGSMICCGAIWFASTQFSGFIAGAMMEELADDPAIVEHIGEVTSSETDLGEAISLSNNDENVAVMVFTVKGDKGSGKVIHRTNNETGETTTTLVMDNGDEYPLQSPQNFGGVETEIEELDQIDSVDVTEMEAENETSEEEQTETETE